MNLRRALFIAACLAPVAAGPAAAQFPPAQPPQQSLQQPQQQQAPGEPPPCIKEFIKLRDDAQKKAGAIQAASGRKAPPKEACALFNSFFAAEMKMIKFAEENSVWCGIPPEAVGQMKKGNLNTVAIRTKVCQAAASGAQQRPAAPTLSDVLTAPIADSNNIKTGRGTFDTLTGTPLGPK
jgi:hypothetical protein